MMRRDSTWKTSLFALVLTMNTAAQAQTPDTAEGPVAPAETAEPTGADDEASAPSPNPPEAADPADTKAADAKPVEDAPATTTQAAAAETTDSRGLSLPDEPAEEPAEEPPTLEDQSLPSTEVSEEDLEEFLAEANLGNKSFQPTLHVYGFADFSYQHYLIGDRSPWRLLYSNKGSFYVGNLNVYFDSRIAETVRSLVEVRFTYLPHGNLTSLGPPSERLNNVSSDYTRSERDIQVGGIRIERAWLEWSPHQLFNVKLGHWLSPYGIWVVDHGSPTIIPVSRPFMIDENLIPESQTGVLVQGRAELTDTLALEYGAGVSNGRGPIDTYFDYDANKGLTGRLKLVYSGPLGDLQVGTTGYLGTYTQAQTGITIDDGQLAAEDQILLQYKEMAIAADVRYTHDGFLFQSEFALNDRAYTDQGRPTSYEPGSLSPDSRRWGVYGLTGYRFKWLGVMPFFIGEYSPIPDTTLREIPQRLVLLGGGVNVRPIAQVVTKLGYLQTIFPDNREGTFDEHPLRRVEAQVAWAF